MPKNLHERKKKKKATFLYIHLGGGGVSKYVFFQQKQTLSSVLIF